MFDINKLSEWKSVLDENLMIISPGSFEIYFSVISSNYAYCDIENSFIVHDKNFDVFCKRVSEAILNAQG